MRSFDQVQLAPHGRSVVLLLVLLSPVLSGCVPTARIGKPEIPTKVSDPLYTQMSKEDVRLANDTVRRALESALSGTTFRWRNPGNDHEGTVMPTSSFRAKAGLFCRTYRETLTIGDRTEPYTEVACRDADGAWRPAAKHK